ncbi:TPA: ABC transporter permease, partial [Candidatus Geothermarchaeota archaeon]|nr:ABC transporter permease [Candidatus Geothermarchaeota archaeon]
MTITKGGVRIIWRKKVETISITFLIIVIVVSYGSLVVLADNMSEHAYRQFRGTLGDVAVFGLFPENITTYFNDLSSIKSVTPLYVWYGTLAYEDEKFLVSIADRRYVDRLAVFQLEGEYPSNMTEAIFYISITGGPIIEESPLDIGENVSLLYFPPKGFANVVNLKVVGVARGFAHIGGMESALIVSSELMDKILGDTVTGVSILLYDEDIDKIESIAKDVDQIVDQNDFTTFFKFVNKKERNPIVVLLESASTILTIPISVVLFLVPVLVASAGSALVIREVKIVATLKSIGMNTFDIFKYYGFPWLIRGLVGLSIGLAILPNISEYIYREFIVRDSEIADILINTLGFIVRPETLLTLSWYIIALVFLGILIPWFIAYKVNIVKAISSTGLYSISPPYRRFMGLVSLRVFIRDVVSRPWKLIGILLSISILWGALAALNMEAAGLNDVQYIYEEKMVFDTSLTISSTSFRILDDLIDISNNLMSQDEDVKGYVILDRRITINLFGLNEVGQLITYVGGDPSIAFPLVKGDFPSGYREVVISKNLAAFKGLDIGDVIEVYVDEEVFRLKVVGISYSRLSNGYYLLVEPNQYAIMLHIDPDEVGKREQVIYVDVVDGVDPDLFSQEIKNLYEGRYPVSVEYTTKNDLMNQLQLINNFILG